MKTFHRSNRFYFLSGILTALLIFAAAGSFYIAQAPVIAGAGPGSVIFPQNYKITTPHIPAELDFAGEKVPLDIPDVKERIEREFIVNTYWHSFTVLAIKRSARYFPIIEPILKENGIPDDFKYLAVIESGLANVVSPAGAAGFWQFMQDPAESYGLRISDEIDERYDVEKATRAACRYLLSAHSDLGSWTLAAASYNMGVNGVQKQVYRQRTNDYYDLYLNEETSRYISRIITFKEIMKNPSSYGFDISPQEMYRPFEWREVTVTAPVEDLALFAINNGSTYKSLKLLNPWLRDNKLPGRKGDSYIIKLPREKDL